MPAALTSAALRSISFRTYASKSFGVMTMGSTKSVAIRSRTLGACNALTVSLCSLSTMSRRVLAGRNSPYQIGYSASLKPASCVVGTSGKAGVRRAPFTTNAVSLPSRTCGSTSAGGPKKKSTRPAITSDTASAPPERGEVHVAISTAGAIQASNHSFETIWLPSLEFVAACNPALRLADGATIDVRSLASYPLLLLDSSFAVRAAFDAACRVAEFKPNIAFESRTPHTLLALAEAGHGVAIVPSVMPTHRYDLQIVRLGYRRRPLREAYAIAWDKRRSLPPSADDFCQSLLTYVREVFPIWRPSEARLDAMVKRRAARRVSFASIRR